MPSTELCSRPTLREQIQGEHIWWKGGTKDARRGRAWGHGADCLFATWCKMVPLLKWLEICVCLAPPLNVKLHFGSRHGNSWAAVIQEGVPATCFAQRRRRHSRRFGEVSLLLTPHISTNKSTPVVIVSLLLFIHFIFFHSPHKFVSVKTILGRNVWWRPVISHRIVRIRLNNAFNISDLTASGRQWRTLAYQS